MSDLIPRLPKRKRQPTAELMRQQLALAADEIIRLRTELATRPLFGFFFGDGKQGYAIGSAVSGYIDPTNRPWWRRLFSRGLS